MNILINDSQKKHLLMLILVLGGANLLLWGTKLMTGFPEGGLYATGTAFAVDGTVLKFSDRIEFKGDHFNYGVNVNWNGKSGTMQETGTATYGVLGELDVDIENATNFGSSMLAEGEWDDEIALKRSYLQSGHAKVSLLPILGEFQNNCYYLLYMKKVYCGSREQRWSSRVP